MNIRIYLDGTYHTIEDNEASNVFYEDGIYTFGEPQGFVYNVSAQNIYLSLFYTLIFFSVCFFVFLYKNRKANYKIDFLNADKNKLFKLLLLLFVIIHLINFFELSRISNIFYNIHLVSKIFLLLVTCQLLFKSKNKKSFFLYLVLLVIVFYFISQLRSGTNLPITYNLIFNFLFLILITCLIISAKNKIKLINIFLLGFFTSIVLISTFIWKENLRSYSNYDWNKLSNKIHIYVINKPFGTDSRLISVLTAPIKRINKLDQFSYIIEKRNEHDLLLGKTYIPILSKFIPRQLWPNKPQETFGNDYGRSYMFIPDYDKTTSVGLSTLIESYINFGFTGILLLGLFYGLLYRYLNNLIYDVKDNNHLSFLFIFISIFLSITSESNLSSGLGGAVQIFIIAIIIKSLIKKDEI